MRPSKLDELIRVATAADDRLIGIERGAAEDIERIRLQVEATVRPVEAAAALAAPGPPPSRPVPNSGVTSRHFGSGAGDCGRPRSQARGALASSGCNGVRNLTVSVQGRGMTQAYIG